MKNFQPTTTITLITALLFCLGSTGLAGISEAQVIIRRLSGSVPEAPSGPEANMAELRTDLDLKASLEKAKRYQTDGNFRVAAELMQNVLNNSDEALYTDDEQTYFGLGRRVELQMAGLPAEGLKVYQSKADAEAMALISAGEQGDLADALKQVVAKFFFSSVGDDAAVRLGRLYLDQYDFVSASRVFEKALTHPDLSVPKAEIMAHVALCDLFLDDLKSAKQKTQQLAESAPGLPIARMIADEIDAIQAGRDNLDSVRNNRSADWKMTLASKQRYGVGLPVNERMLEPELVAAFQFYFDPSQRLTKKSTTGSLLTGSAAYGDDVKKTLTSAEKRMIGKRKKYGWRPTGLILFGPDDVYIKGAHEIVALKKSELPINFEESSSSALQVDDSTISWQSPRKYLFEIDAGTFVRDSILNRGRIIMPGRGGPSRKASVPASTPEIQNYGDRIAAQFSIHNGVLYSIEGRPANDDGKVKRRSQIKIGVGQKLTRARDNFLVAYDTTQGGKVIWTLPKPLNEGGNVADGLGETTNDNDTEIASNSFLELGGLMGAPVGYKNSVIAPVNRDGEIWIYAFDPNNQGATLWKKLLCDEPRTGANPWSAINVSIDENDLLVSSGLGVVFVLDATTGQIRFARRYDRGGEQDKVLAVEKWVGINKFVFDQGWSSDTIIPFGRQLICFCSDAKAIESIDRETGKTLWKSDFELSSQKPDYLLGVYDGVLYAAGPTTITAFDLKTGKPIWGGDDLFDGDVSMGKGILTPQGVFVPVGNKILQFDLKPQELTTQPASVRSISVDLGGADVGNLFSDGERFWVHGGNRIYALEAKPE